MNEKDLEPVELDCGDNSCYFAKNKGGMRTNGGCRCFERAGISSRSTVKAALELLPKYLSLAKKNEDLQKAYNDECDRTGEQWNELRSQLTAAQADAETLRMQLAACGVAAMCNTEETKAKQRIDRDNPYWSASYGDVCAAVDREMQLRAILATLEALVVEKDRALEVALKASKANLAVYATKDEPILLAAHDACTKALALTPDSVSAKARAWEKLKGTAIALDCAVAEFGLQDVGALSGVYQIFHDALANLDKEGQR